MTRNPIQLDLFNRTTMNVIKPFKLALGDDAKASGMSREQIVERMNDLADRHGLVLVHGNGRRLTIETFEKWLNPGDLGRMMPLKALPAFCAATGRCSAFSAVAEPLGLKVIGEREQKLLAWAEAKLVVKQQGLKIRKLEEEL